MESNCTDVYIKMNTGKTSQFNVSIYDTVQSLCDQIAQQEKVKSQQVTLKYQGKLLEKYKTIQEYGIRIETILIAQILIPHNVPITFSLEDGRKDELTISNMDNAATLYQTIGDKILASVEKINLYVNDRLIPRSSCTVENVGLVTGCNVKVTFQAKTTSNGNDVEQLDETMKQMIMSSFDAKTKQVEVVFSFDTTGSMYCYLETVREKLGASCNRLIQEIPNIRIGIIAHGDYCDSESNYALRNTDLTSNVNELVNFAQNVPATSGGDSPECYELVLKKAQQLDWSEDSAKALVMIGDNHPHPPSYTDQKLQWHDDLEILTGMGIKVYGVQAGSDTESTQFYQEIADLSGGCYLKLDHIDVITDMFLAVCYHETDQEMLNVFEQELAAKCDVNQGTQAMISQLKQEANRKEKKHDIAQKRFVGQPWWDISLDSGQPTYLYVSETDKWTLVNRHCPVFRNESERHSETQMDRCRQKKKKICCSIM